MLHQLYAHFLSIDLSLLFFFLGMLAAALRSDLSIPADISKFLSIFMLLALGLKGGHEVRISPTLEGLLPTLSIGFFFCALIPAVYFFAFRRWLGLGNATGVAAAYGSVSAITFITAVEYLENEGITSSGYMVAAMAMMEIPAIILALYLYGRWRASSTNTPASWRGILTGKSVVLLLGGFAIGLALNEKSWNSISPVVVGSFKGVLAFFLLDLGLLAQNQIRQALQLKWRALVLAVALPLTMGTLAALLLAAAGIERGNLVLMSALVGSASYIAAPAAIRASVPDASPAFYVALPLAITFPMNVLIGIPYYISLSAWLLGG
ncbi:MAG TPA: sodium-dependent bicarbonate transport family permease [Pseudobdellovibrionaceae bacterium]|nr:sodium-dependent bicarbonate transport family permease [Pseudobdellovibrionaceae bacterium]